MPPAESPSDTDPVPDGDLLVGIVGAAASDLGGLESAVSDLGGQFASGTAAHVVSRKPDVVLAVGDDALTAIVQCDTIERQDDPVPVLPVGCGDGVRSVPIERTASALRSVVAGEATAREYPTIAARIEDVTDERDDTTVGRGFFDVTLATEKPAKISEYAVRTGTEPIDRFRADGVVVATPAGSHGYASAAGSPTLTETVDAVVVVPIAPFVTERDQWVVASTDLALTVERDETVVSLQIDGRVIETVDAGTTLAIDPGPSLTLLATDECGAVFE